jgi:hypothetical protein
MQLQLAVRNTLDQLAGSLFQLTSREYVQPCPTLSGHSIGQHVRHIIELFQALENGYAIGLVNYEKRKRDKAIEGDKEIASRLLDQIGKSVDRQDKPLLLEASYDGLSAEPVLFTSNYYRELAYNLEHTIHHMALIRIGINESGSTFRLPDNFGIASSTLQYRRQCAQ